MPENSYKVAERVSVRAANKVKVSVLTLLQFSSPVVRFRRPKDAAIFRGMRRRAVHKHRCDRVINSVRGISGVIRSLDVDFYERNKTTNDKSIFASKRTARQRYST